MKNLKQILKDESGQGMLEYVILLAAIVAIGLIFKDPLVHWFQGTFQGVTSQGSSLFQSGGSGPG